MRPSVVVGLALLALAGCGRAGPGAARGPWHLAYDGYGHISVSTNRGATRLTLEPARPASPADTHAALVLSSASWRDLTAEIRIRTNRQLRQPHPNPWEVGWLLWHYLDDHHFYYIALKPNGWELGKAEPGYPGGQRFLVTGAHPAFPTGRWYTVGVWQRGSAIQVTVDGRPLVRFADSRNPYLGGRIGLYVEDASATFQPLSFRPAA